MTPQLLVTVLVLAPLLGAIIAGLFGRLIRAQAAMVVTTGLLFLSCAVAWLAFFQVIFGSWGDFTVHLAPFIDVGAFRSAWSVRVDPLSAVMGVVVTTVSALVHLYSFGYMAEDPHKPRFFAYLSFFTFAMLALVTAADFMQLFFGWEGVGLASYLLIGFWYERPTANSAAIKAFVVNRIGDFGFALGIMTVFWAFGSIRFADVFAAVPAHAHLAWSFAGRSWPLMDLACSLLFVGAMGKSAQFFLHTWLPDAMEGPTPVSALIHAATMVTAGVYMVCLLSPMFEYAPAAKDLVTVIGAMTALFAATVGLAQNDIKRVIAYSTCSQLGYMFVAAGVGAYQGAMFHLFTHAFFKALLFLAAGSVITGMHHEQDMRKMGALGRVMPVTYAVMLIATLSITGVGIPGLGLGFSGFYSKDAIINAAWAASSDPAAAFGFVSATLVAGLTAFYSWRLVFMTFNGKPHWGDAADHDASHTDHGEHGHMPHESPWVMLAPLVVLAIGALAAGGLFDRFFIGEDQKAFWRASIFHVGGLAPIPEPPAWVAWSPLILMLAGVAIAWWAYIARPDVPARFARGPIWAFLYNKWYFDEIYDAVFVRGAEKLGDLLWKGGDRAIIDGLGPDGVSALSYVVGRGAGRAQTGYVYHYAFVMLLGIAGLLSYALWAFTR
ncbi:MAG TPA: NADH-quinone oxidoreductase subunit L [Caulobacteraceae bacterium]|nr:NADH-quinone oxidoreductase subunit L [Caulobacteraceae bacterium]